MKIWELIVCRAFQSFQKCANHCIINSMYQEQQALISLQKT